MSILSRFIKKVVRATEEATEPDVVMSFHINVRDDDTTEYVWMPEDLEADALYAMLADAWSFVEKNERAQALVDGKTVH